MHTSDTPRNPTDQADQPTARRRDNLRQSTSLSSEAAGSPASMSSDSGGSGAAEGATPASGETSPATSSPATDCPGQSLRTTGLESGDDPDSLIRQDEAALLLGVSNRCLENWRYRGGGPNWIRISARCIRYRRSDLIQFIEARVRISTAIIE